MPNSKPAKGGETESRRRKATVDGEWFQNRMEALGVSNADIAPEFGLAPNKVWQMKAGKRAVQVHELLIWARVLRVHPAEVFERLGLEWPRATVPIVGSVGARGAVSPLTDGSRTEAPGERADDLVAIRLAQSWPAAGLYRGALLFYAPSLTVHVSAFGRLSVLGFGDHELPVVGVLESAALGQARAIVPGSGESVTSSQAISAAPVLWIKAG